jgi:hypothetical protein
MNFSLNNNANQPFANAEDPNICPHCHVANQPTILFINRDVKLDKLVSVWKCTYVQCNKIFAVSHINNGDGYTIERNLIGLPKGPIWPQPIIDLKDGQTIDETSPLQSKFIKTYLQSLEAESNGYDEISGMGYRKSIEYLVKDWAIQSKPSEKAHILKMWLGQVIANYYSGDLKDILERATWLGNDHSHYNKLFEEFNINHLKELIDLIMVELDREFKKKHYIDNIESKK